MATANPSFLPLGSRTLLQDTRSFLASAHPLVPRAGREGTVTEPGAQPQARGASPHQNTLVHPQARSSCIALHQSHQIWTSCVSLGLNRKGEEKGESKL